MKIVTSTEMKNLENTTMQNLGILSIVLMENAGIGATNVCLDYLSKFDNPTAVVFCGKGNNGGDGFVVARQLFNHNINVSVVIYGDIEKATPDCLINYNIVNALPIPILNYSDENIDKIITIIKQSNLCVDALIGTGLKSALYPSLDNLVDLINAYSNYIVSIDIPTGVNSDNGDVPSMAIKSNETVTFHLPKLGHYLSQGTLNIGKLTISQIGINYDKTQLALIKGNILTDNEAKSMLPIRKINSHKGNFGKLFVFSGSASMTGAAYFNCSSAYKVGCGIVNACVVSDVANVIHNLLPETVTTILPDKKGYLYSNSFYEVVTKLAQATAILTGSGLGNTPETKEFLKLLIKNATSPIILDADALNIISEDKSLLSLLSYTNIPCIITPHLGEMSRLTELSIKEISKDIVKIAIDFSKKYNVVTVLKDFHTVIANPDGDFYINKTGCSAMSKGGTGDCLAGIIGGLLSQGLTPFNSAVLGCYLNGKSGEKSAEILGNYSVSASTIIDSLPYVLKDLKN